MFSDFKAAVTQQFARMQDHELFRVQIERNELWDAYLAAFPAGTNPMFETRTEHDCVACRHFIRDAGNMLAIIDGELVSIWDVTIGGHYQVVADALSRLVKSREIANVFRSSMTRLGVDCNHSRNEDTGEVTRWDHFFIELPSRYVLSKDALPTFLGRARTHRATLERSLREISHDAIDAVLDLIENQSLYRGEEHAVTLRNLQGIKRKFEGAESDIAMPSAPNEDAFLWQISLKMGPSSNFRGTVIGTLLVDLTEGVDLEEAVKRFEVKVAPTNYRRTSALITQSMINKAEEKVKALGIEGALHRRHAVTEDLTVPNILFADRDAKKRMGAGSVFEQLRADVPDKAPGHVTEIGIQEFQLQVLSGAENLEAWFENRHSNNLMSVIAPEDVNAPPILRWNNNFSWTYNGGVTDSITEKVKRAGGRVDGDLRCSLAWWNHDDLDLHMIEPDGFHIYFSNRRSPRGGTLDVDMNAGRGLVTDPVENITYPVKHCMLEGVYELKVNNYRKRASMNVGFEVEIEFDGTVHSYQYANAVRDGETITVARFEFSRKKGITFLQSLPSTQASKEVWGLATQKFHRVPIVMLSPNHWDDNAAGNKHWFFILDGCLNPDKVHGFYNEFLRSDLIEHRKVFEVLSTKLKAPFSEQQLSGLGFSSTLRNHMLCRVTADGSKRTYKVNF